MNTRLKLGIATGFIVPISIGIVNCVEQYELSNREMEAKRDAVFNQHQASPEVPLSSPPADTLQTTTSSDAHPLKSTAKNNPPIDSTGSSSQTETVQKPLAIGDPPTQNPSAGTTPQAAVSSQPAITKRVLRGKITAIIGTLSSTITTLNPDSLTVMVAGHPYPVTDVQLSQDSPPALGKGARVTVFMKGTRFVACDGARIGPITVQGTTEPLPLDSTGALEKSFVVKSGPLRLEIKEAEPNPFQISEGLIDFGNSMNFESYVSLTYTTDISWPSTDEINNPVQMNVESHLVCQAEQYAVRGFMYTNLADPPGGTIGSNTNDNTTEKLFTFQQANHSSGQYLPHPKKAFLRLEFEWWY